MLVCLTVWNPASKFTVINLLTGRKRLQILSISFPMNQLHLVVFLVVFFYFEHPVTLYLSVKINEVDIV